MDKKTDNRSSSFYSTNVKRSRSSNTGKENTTLLNTTSHCSKDEMQKPVGKEIILTNDLSLTPSNKCSMSRNDKSYVIISSTGTEYKTGYYLQEGLNKDISNREENYNAKRTSKEGIESPIWRKTKKSKPDMEHILNTIVGSESDENEFPTFSRTKSVRSYKPETVDKTRRNLKKNIAEVECASYNSNKNSSDVEMISERTQISEEFFTANTQLILQNFQACKAGQTRDSNLFPMDQKLSPEGNNLSQCTTVLGDDYNAVRKKANLFNLTEDIDFEDEKTILCNNDNFDIASSNVKEKFDDYEENDDIVITPVLVENGPQVSLSRAIDGIDHFQASNSPEFDIPPYLEMYYANTTARSSNSPKSDTPPVLEMNCNETLAKFSTLSIESDSTLSPRMIDNKNTDAMYNASINDAPSPDMFEDDDSNQCTMNREISEYFISSDDSVIILSERMPCSSKTLGAIELLSNYSSEYVETSMKKKFMPMYTKQENVENAGDEFVQKFYAPDSEICTNIDKALDTLNEVL